MKSVTIFTTENSKRYKNIVAKNFDLQFITTDPFKTDKEIYLPPGSICIIDSSFTTSGGIDFSLNLQKEFNSLVLVFCVKGNITNELVKKAVSIGKVYRIISLDWPDANILNTLHEAFAYSTEIKKHIFLLKEEHEKNQRLTSTEASLKKEDFLNVESLMYADQMVQYAKSSIESYNQILSAIGSGKKSKQLLNSIREKINRLVPVDAISLCFRSKRISSDDKLNISISFTDKEKNKETLLDLSKTFYEKIVEKLAPDSRNKISKDFSKNSGISSLCEVVNDTTVESSLIIPLIHQEKYMGNLVLLRFAKPYFKKRERLIVEHFSEAGNIIARGFRNFEYFEKTKKEWESTFDAISDPVAIIDPEFNIIRANKAFVATSKFTIDSISGEKCHVVLAGSKTPCPTCPMQKSIRERRVRTCEELKLQDKCYNVWSYPVEDQDKDIKSVVVFYRDITGEKVLTGKLMDADKKAEIGILAGSVAHEINNPLGGILAFSQIILRELSQNKDEGSQIFEDIKEIEIAALRGKRIVESLLNFSRMSKAEEFSYINITDIIDTAISLVEYNARLYNIKISSKYEKGLPAIFGNYNQILQVVLSIISNTINSMITFENSAQKKIKILVKMDKKTSRISVKFIDFGPLISKDKLSKIFNPNVLASENDKSNQDETIETRAELGLSIAYGIIQDHNGTISVQSNKKDGNTYCMNFPVSKDSTFEAMPFKISIQGKI